MTNEEIQQSGQARKHNIAVRRTARYYTLGELSANTREIWFAVHGYGQLAEYFIRHFRPLDDGSRVIVAPEALSRFYVKEWTRVGASWITKEERESEIAEYVQYLSDVKAAIWEELQQKGGNPATVRLVGCGFSQGVTTLTRWLIHEKISAERLVCWGGDIPRECNLPAHFDALNRMKPLFVIGKEDEFITPTVLETMLTHYRSLGLDFEFIPFDGGHVMDAELLHRIVQGW
ncbi:MAG: phospholipase [Candidatus Kapaibacterium sp.]|nr:MAG: phospholipase [Candidatus Kapabacteria bacterium]